MCLILFAYRVHPDYPLILTANRDEFHARPSVDAGYWETPGTARILAGKDKLAGGTWLGITESGRFAAVTNIRDPGQKTDKPRSRGELPTAFLGSDETAFDYCQQVASRSDEYLGFNLLVSDGQQMCYINNRDGSTHELEPGIYGLSNAQLDSDWPKVSAGKRRLSEMLSQRNPSTDDLLAIMADRQVAADEALPQTGVPLAMERTLSATFILDRNIEYGTRCSTAVLFQSDGGFRFSERNFDSSGEVISHHHFESVTDSEHAA